MVESLGFEPEGSGEHVFLYLEKSGENTEFVSRVLARFAGVRQRDIGYAGLKDRHAVARQWFSVWLPGKDGPDWAGLEELAQVKVLQVARHARKLKRGVLRGNHFQITLRDWSGDNAIAVGQLELLARQGFPNYFAEQRFGHDGGNIRQALAVFAGKKVKPEQRSIYLSAARGFLFNQVLAARVLDGSWLTGLPGEVFNLQGGHSLFQAGEIDEVLRGRIAAGDIHPTGLLYGAGAKPNVVEQAVLADEPALTDGLERAGLEADRRALRVLPLDLRWRFGEQELMLEFSLPAGAYATALLREVASCAAGADQGE